jgi:hypothetical protein
MRNSLFAILVTLSLLSSTAFAQSKSCEQQNCIAVVDVGSTGSRLHIFSYDKDETNTPINIHERFTKKVAPGFATLNPDQTVINDYLTKLLDGAPEYGNPMPLYFYATAGMRFLPQPKQNQLYAQVSSYFGTQQQWDLKQAKTITGTQEGIFDWLAINYQLDKLKSNNTVGVMDMGGASVQIAFPVRNNPFLPEKNLQQFDLYGKHHTIFVQSFLGLGQNESARQFMDTKTCFPKNYPLSSGEAADGNAYSCMDKTSKFVNSFRNVNALVQSATKTNPVSEWYILGGLVYTAKSKPFNFENQEFSNKALLEAAQQKVCTQEWSNLNDPKQEMLYNYCFLPAYYYSLVVNGYGIPAEKPLRYLGADKSDDWTLGVVLYQQDQV